MKTEDYLKFIVKNIHTVITATVDDNNLPVTAAIDIMDYDKDSLYFLTAKGKNFYNRLIKRKYIALTGLKGEDTMTSVAVSLRGKVSELGYNKIPELFEKNPYMKEIYPTEKSMKALSVFRIHDGVGEWFDLSKKPIERESFVFGNIKTKKTGYFITDKCKGCKKCINVCPQNCIVTDKIPFVIESEHCLHCGNCLNICPFGAVEFI